MAAETCVLMGMVKCKMGSFKSALNVRSFYFDCTYHMFGNTETDPQHHIVPFLHSYMRIHYLFSNLH